MVMHFVGAKNTASLLLPEPFGPGEDNKLVFTPSCYEIWGLYSIWC